MHTGMCHLFKHIKLPLIEFLWKRPIVAVQIMTRLWEHTHQHSPLRCFNTGLLLVQRIQIWHWTLLFALYSLPTTNGLFLPKPQPKLFYLLKLNQTFTKGSPDQETIIWVLEGNKFKGIRWMNCRMDGWIEAHSPQEHILFNEHNLLKSLNAKSWETFSHYDNPFSSFIGLPSFFHPFSHAIYTHTSPLLLLPPSSFILSSTLVCFPPPRPSPLLSLLVQQPSY